MSNSLNFTLRQQELVKDENGYRTWRACAYPAELVADETALVLCDIWDIHWCRGANQRLAALLPRMSEVVQSARGLGVLIIHAPSDTLEFYRDSPARKRVLAAPTTASRQELPHDDPAQPIDSSDGGNDTDDNVGAVNELVWTRQHPAIEIDDSRDGISDDGQELYNLFVQRGIKNVLIMGVHANMCILNRSFAIKQMVRWGFDVALIRDLTDSMYNPARPPYVSHEEGTHLTIEFIEKFWCPTVDSGDLL